MRARIVIVGLCIVAGIGLATSLQATLVGGGSGGILDPNGIGPAPLDPNNASPDPPPDANEAPEPEEIAPEEPPPPVHFDPWPPHVDTRPGIMPPPYPWPRLPTHILNLPGDPDVQYINAELPEPNNPEEYPPDPNTTTVTVLTNIFGEALITISTCPPAPGECTPQEFIFCDCPECNMTVCGDVTEVSIWLGFSDINDNGVFNDGDSYALVISAYVNGTRINYHLYNTGDGQGWQ